MSPTRILVVDDDEPMRQACVGSLERHGYAVFEAADGRAALEVLATSGATLVLTDVRMPKLDGLDLLDEIHRRLPSVDVIVMTGFGTIDNAVEAMRRGAADYVTKPFKQDELLFAVSRATRLRELESEVDRLQQGVESRYRFDAVIANSAAMREVLDAMSAASRSPANLLITGESGTGKDLVARAVHHASPRARAPFVPVNCASLPADLIESELFGHTKGAFTGASDPRAGLIRAAEGGTLLLDEITEMPTTTQAKLLRVLQDKRVRPVGGTHEVKVDFRLVAATNRDVKAAVARGSLREDLYYRIDVLRIRLPPVRERSADILPLFRHFLAQAARESDTPAVGVDADAADALLEYAWPGNVREIANLAERVVAMGVRKRIRGADVRRFLAPHKPPEPGRETAAGADDVTRLAEVEREAVLRALHKAGGNKSEAARLLGVARKTLYDKLRRHGLD